MGNKNLTKLTDEGDGLVGKSMVYIARKVEGLHIVRKSGAHRGSQGKLYGSEVYIDIAIEKKRV